MDRCIFSTFEWLLLLSCFKMVNTDLYVHLQGSNSCDCVHQRLSCFTCNQYRINPYTARRNIHKVYLPNLPSYLTSASEEWGRGREKNMAWCKPQKTSPRRHLSKEGSPMYLIGKKAISTCCSGLLSYLDFSLWPYFFFR